MKRKALLLISLATIAFNNSIIIVNADTTNHSDEKRAEKFFKKIKNFNQKINQDKLIRLLPQIELSRISLNQPTRKHSISIAIGQLLLKKLII